MMITAAVGQGGRNTVPEVSAVQLLLNDWRGAHQLGRITVDGRVGPQTIDAIVTFQKRNGLVADGRIDPTGPTLKRLERRGQEAHP